MLCLVLICGSVAQSCPTLCDPMDCSTSGFPVLHHLLKFAQTHLHLLNSIATELVFSNESALRIRWQKYWNFSFSISPSNEYSGLISFTINWFDLLVAQGTLKSLLLHHNSKASILRRSAFFTVQLSHPSWLLENHSLDYTDLGQQVMALLFNMLSLS